MLALVLLLSLNLVLGSAGKNLNLDEATDFESAESDLIVRSDRARDSGFLFDVQELVNRSKSQVEDAMQKKYKSLVVLKAKETSDGGMAYGVKVNAKDEKDESTIMHLHLFYRAWLEELTLESIELDKTFGDKVYIMRDPKTPAASFVPGSWSDASGLEGYMNQILRNNKEEIEQKLRTEFEKMDLAESLMKYGEDCRFFALEARALDLKGSTKTVRILFKEPNAIDGKPEIVDVKIPDSGKGNLTDEWKINIKQTY